MATSIYNFPEEVFGDAPGSSLYGGISGTGPKLAQAVEDELSRIESTIIAGIETRLQAAEAAVANLRWRHISSGTFAGTSTVLTVPAGHQRLRLTLLGDLAAVGTVGVRINEDATAGRHRYGNAQINSSGALVFPVFSEGTRWALAEWGTAESNSTVVDIFPTDASAPGSSDQPSFLATGYRNSSSAGAHRKQFAWGSYLNNAVVSSLEITAGGIAFNGGRYWLEGWVTI